MAETEGVYKTKSGPPAIPQFAPAPGSVSAGAARMTTDATTEKNEAQPQGSRLPPVSGYLPNESTAVASGDRVASQRSGGRDDTHKTLNVISLGAGLQSTTMALMAACGELEPMPAAAIFSDTQDEPAAVYETLDWIADKLPFPVHRVTAGKLSDKILSGKIIIPSFGSRGGMNLRRCTERYKIRPINRFLRGRQVTLWIGISLDEVHRMKANKLKRVTNRWPLIEKRMTRWDCERWLKAHGFPKPAKSACRYCPYHSDATWRGLLAGGERGAILAMDKFLNDRGQFLHRTLKPLDQVDFSNDEDRGQQVMFGNECEGMCGV